MYLAVQNFSGPSHTLNGSHFLRNTCYFRNIAIINLSKQLTLAWLRQVYPFAEWEISNATFSAPHFILSFAYAIKKEFAATCPELGSARKWSALNINAHHKCEFIVTLESRHSIRYYSQLRQRAGWTPGASMLDYFRKSWAAAMHSHLVINNNLFMFTMQREDDAFVAGPKNVSLTKFIYPVTSKLMSRHWSIFATKHSASITMLKTYTA
jgi:hypothetical protein